jgi:hypothetical protein
MNGDRETNCVVVLGETVFMEVWENMKSTSGVPGRAGYTAGEASSSA